MTYQQRKNLGFTIIEVMIVLAIAGLIMLIVFLAVPALQRTSRNTQRTNDAAGALQAINEYVTNNGGSLPASLAFAAPNLTVGATGTAQSSAKLGYYVDASSVSLATSYAALPANATDTLTIYEGTRCASATNSAVGNSRQIAAVYGIETTGGYTWQCKES
jgi:prepilin-type N-terminal cleavage/methylation domain-containing protein